MTADGWLTVADVEDVHHAVQAGVAAERISSALSQVKQATMPALVEYGCLRVSLPNLPELPPVIRGSQLGQSLAQVVSPIGVRTRGNVSQPPLDMKPRVSEFLTFESADDMVSDRVHFFKMRFWKSAQQEGFGTNISACLSAGLNEMMTNAVQHAASTLGILAGYAVQPNVAQFIVADLGRGVLASLRQVEKYDCLNSHSEAIRLALHDGVTSDLGGRGGNGFRDIFKALAEQWGYLRFRSGEGCLVMDGAGLNPDGGCESAVPLRPGFQVSVTCFATTPSTNPASPQTPLV